MPPSVLIFVILEAMLEMRDVKCDLESGLEIQSCHSKIVKL